MNKIDLANIDEEKQNGVQKIIPFLWFDRQAEEAVNFYASVFKKSRIGEVTQYGKEGCDVHGVEEGAVMTVDFDRGAEICGLQWQVVPGVLIGMIQDNDIKKSQKAVKAMLQMKKD